MSPKLDKLIEEVLALSGEDRARLADRLVESLDPLEDETVRDLWVAEVVRRYTELHSGAARAIPSADVIAEARKRLDNR